MAHMAMFRSNELVSYILYPAPSASYNTHLHAGSSLGIHTPLSRLSGCGGNVGPPASCPARAGWVAAKCIYIHIGPSTIGAGGGISLAVDSSGVSAGGGSISLAAGHASAGTDGAVIISAGSGCHRR